MNTAVEYKYLRKNGDRVVWEGDPNRVRNVGAPASCAVTWTDSWR